MALVQNWYLPIAGGALNVPVNKAFSPSRGRKKTTPQNPADLAVRFFLLSHLFRLVFFAVEQETKSSLSYKKQDNDGYNGSDQEQQSLLYFPRPTHVLHRKTKTTGPQNTTTRITKIHSSRGGGRQEGEVGG